MRFGEPMEVLWYALNIHLPNLLETHLLQYRVCLMDFIGLTRYLASCRKRLLICIFPMKMVISQRFLTEIQTKLYLLLMHMITLSFKIITTKSIIHGMNKTGNMKTATTVLSSHWPEIPPI